MYYAGGIKKVVFGKPIKFDGAKPIEEQRKAICEYIMQKRFRTKFDAKPLFYAFRAYLLKYFTAASNIRISYSPGTFL